MTNDVQQLVREAIELTDAAAPAMLDADAPVLARAQREGIYLIGLVGGKEVGKSSLVNAIVGQDITRATSHGPGTQSVIAYVHESSIDELRELLEREVPGEYSLVPHRIDHLRRQVLLDLPDIDSKYGRHLQITRTMLRHMLYPLWVQSVEKYADLKPRELLAAVSEGNDPSNFVFCLNKVDQLSESEQAELRDDFADRLARTLKLGRKPDVYLISALKPTQFDLPALRDKLSRQRDESAVRQSLDLAQRRQDRSLLSWVGGQRLAERAAQLARMKEDAEQIAASRIAVPILDVAIPRLLDDPGLRMGIVAPAIRMRMARWPLVNALDGMLAPLLMLVQKNLSASPSGSVDPDAHMNGSVAANVQAAFAQLHQLHPQLGKLYSDQRLWEPMSADIAAAELRRRFAAAIDRQREAVLARARSRFSGLLAPLRWLLTIGAVLWFPFVQPVLSVMLADGAWDFSRRTLRVLVDSLSVVHLLQCTTFLLMWFGILWLLLRFSAQRRVNRMLDRWKADEQDELSLARQTLQWTESLLDPIRHRHERFIQLDQRARELNQRLLAG